MAQILKSALLATASVLFAWQASAQVKLPESAAYPLGSEGAPGFRVRTAQAPQGVVLNNNFIRAIQQLDGTLVGADGTPVQDTSAPGGNPDGTYTVDTVDFGIYNDKNSGQFGLEVDPPADVPFPGLFDGDGAHTDYFSTEVITYLRLTKGIYTFGVTAGGGRTDENDDDGWSMFVGANPKSYFNTKIAEYQRTLGGFPSEAVQLQGNTNEFQVEVTADGVYPIRLVQWQTRLKTMLEFYIVYDIDTDTPSRYLVNDPNFPLIAYESVNDPKATSAYVAEVSPLPGSSGIAPNTAVTALLVDGTSPIKDSTIKLSLNGTSVTPQGNARSGNKVLLTYNPNAARTNPNNLFKLDFSDNAGTAFSQSWQFDIKVAGAVRTIVRGQWDFDNYGLDATVGRALEYLDGANGVTAQKTEFGTTTEFLLPPINGQSALVMKVPGDLDRNIGYKMYHQIAPNGGGTRVNQYTIIYDLYVDVTGPGAASLLQISSLNNTDDGDLFWQGSNFGQGTDGYKGTGIFKPGEWHRIAAAYDLAANPPVVTKYVDGIKQDDWTANQALDGDRRALKEYGILFGDGDQDERRTMYVNSIQIREGKLTDAEMAILGGPSAYGIPQEIPSSTVTGQWDFNNGDLSATVGRALEFLDGADGVTKAGTEFGTTTDLGVDDIKGVPAKVMKVPGDLDRNIGYKMFHQIAPNGGGTRVNQYTIIYDLYVEAKGPGAASLLQISSLNNTDDGDLFWQGNNFGQGNDGYKGTGIFKPGEWHRISAAYDLAANPPVVTKYVDGVKQDDWTANQALDGDRRALKEYAILFGDGDQDERRTMWVNSIQIRAGKMTDAQLAALGGPSADGIPVATPDTAVKGQWDFNNGDLSATVGKPLTYLDGDNGVTKAGTIFGTTPDIGVDNINDEVASVMQVPGDLDRNIGYIMDHGIAPNGGGSRVNQYTIVMDLWVNDVGPGAASLLQISSLNNTDDGDLFWQGNNFGQGNDGYKGTGIFKPGEWHRIAAAYNLAAKPPVVTKYVDGIFQDDWTANQALDGDRRALKPTAILFGDGDQDERRRMWVNSIQISEGVFSKAKLAALGAPTAAGIPLVVSEGTSPTLTVHKTRTGLLLLWPTTFQGYTLESTVSLDTPDWKPVADALPNSAEVSYDKATQFYRLTQ